MQPFVPLVENPHALTILAHFWPHGLDERRYRVARHFHQTDPGVRVLILSQQPEETARGQVILVHGLEGTGDSVYMKSMAGALLQAGFGVHRLNLRGCGGTEEHSCTAYHSGLTVDLRKIATEMAATGPVFVAGFSLGGNVALKLAGELGEEARPILAGVCAVSTPIDLEAGVRRLEERQNRIYEQRFLTRIRARVRLHAGMWPDFFGSLDGLDDVRSLREFDDRFTACWFGFDGAAGYYRTQSCCRLLDRIRVPSLLVQAQDDPVVPFESFQIPELRDNPAIELVAPAHGGHLGFLARRRPRFWADALVAEWLCYRVS